MPRTRQRPDSYRVRFVIDEHAQFEECNGESRPLTAEEYAQNEYMDNGRTVPYERYLEYQGNPERHVYLGCIVDRQCGCCQTWNVAGSLWGIDTMDDDPAYRALDLERNFTPLEAAELPGYLREVALEQLEESGYKLPDHLYCALKGCKFWHVAGSRYCAQHKLDKA